MSFRAGQDIIDFLRGKRLQPKCLGRYYNPIYNKYAPLCPKEFDIYNKDGQKMRTFFIRDMQLAHIPFFASKYFIWDRFNFGLKTHFYTHNCMLETMGNPYKRYGMLIESESIMPEDYLIFDKHKGLEKDFDLIFTYSAKLLDKLDNARLVPFAANLYGKFGDADLHKGKTKDVSILSSNKIACEMHKFRYDLAMKCKQISKVDTFGTFDGGERVGTMSEVLKDYRYNICLENDIQPYYFSERLIETFSNQTIPIYCGATKIDEFFNPDGIIKIDTKTDIEKILTQCTKEEYERRLPAVLDNYERAKRYTNAFDYMFEKYLQ
ncbi:hypothetical protein IJ732_00405 [bacterium]|nr:hypothetical protein [bacterium]